MNVIVLGTSHEFQCDDPGLKTLITELIEREDITIIAEENRLLSRTLGQQIAESMSLRWIQIDMMLEDRINAGIDQKLSNRMQIRGYDKSDNPIMAIRYAPVEDGIRENFWLDRIEKSSPEGTALVVCGCLHCLPFSEKAEKRGHRIIAQLFYPDSLSQLKPELF